MTNTELTDLSARIREKLQSQTEPQNILRDVRILFDFGIDGGLIVSANDTLEATDSPQIIVLNDTSELESDDFSCCLRLSLSTMESIAEGKLSGTAAYMMGKLKVSGSLGLAKKVASLLED